MVQSELKITGGAFLSAVTTTSPAHHKNNLFGSIRTGITDAGTYTDFLPESNETALIIEKPR
jgi:hypothetical protein